MSKIVSVLFFAFAASAAADDCLSRYQARIVSVYDGDTVSANISLGLDTVLVRKSIRLTGINAPEVRGKEKSKGIVTRDRLKQWVDGKDVMLVVSSDKKDKHGRILATIYLDGKSINDRLVAEGLAVYKEY